MDRASLRDMGTIPVDDVIQYVHKGLERFPSDLELYRRYLRQRWDVYELDFTEDRRGWATLDPATQQSFLRVATGFHHGERQVEVDLVPLLLAMPTEEAKVYLTSQLEDEARHTIFFDRFYREVVGYDAPDIQGVLDASFTHMSETFVGSFGLLAYLVDALRRDPENVSLLVQAAVNYFLWIEGVLALSVMKITLNFCKRRNVLPAFYTGFNATARDEARHVQFGLSLLHRLIHEDPRRVEDVHRTLDTLLSVSSIASQRVRYEPLGFTAPEVTQILNGQLAKKLEAIGVSLPDHIAAKMKTVQPEALAGG
ncbi:MAG: ribonucleotide-diphosphate reductase subunit beta [Actinomycetia bacterium]|nr:ribonucleotide-diphosphate reductase subunit beta [Actinomycetes bacterium]